MTSEKEWPVRGNIPRMTLLQRSPQVSPGIKGPAALA